jgi:HEAT repeat protein
VTSDRLEQALHSADPDVRRQAVYRMSLRPQGTPLVQILDALSDTDWRVRREAISLAAQTREKDALIDALLARLLATDNIGLRNAAIEVLGMVAQGQASKFAKACEEAGEGARKWSKPWFASGALAPKGCSRSGSPRRICFSAFPSSRD